MPCQGNNNNSHARDAIYCSPLRQLPDVALPPGMAGMSCWKLHDVSPWDGLPFHLAPAVVVPWFEGWIPG